MTIASECAKLAESLPELIAGLEDARKATADSMAALKRAGLIYAKTHMRQGKYLYLIYPMQDGERKREYVGTDAKKIEETHAAIERAKEYDALKAQLERIEQRLYTCRLHIREAVNALRKQW